MPCNVEVQLLAGLPDKISVERVRDEEVEFSPQSIDALGHPLNQPGAFGFQKHAQRAQGPEPALLGQPATIELVHEQIVSAHLECKSDRF